MLFTAWTSIYHNFLCTQKRRAYATRADSCRQQIGTCTQIRASGLYFLRAASPASLCLPHTALLLVWTCNVCIWEGLKEARHLWNAKLISSSAPGTMKLCFSPSVFSIPSQPLPPTLQSSFLQSQTHSCTLQLLSTCMFLPQVSQV